MSESNSNSSHGHVLAEAASILRACQPLSDRLLDKGLTIELTPQEQTQLLSFEKLLQEDYDDRDWSYLRVASGVKVNGVAALRSCLNRLRSGEEKRLYGQL